MYLRSQAKTLNLNLPPVKSCAKGVPCTKSCYAMKAYRLYPNVKSVWDENLQLATTDLERFFHEISCWLVLNNDPRFFRWHSAGDILSQEYLEGMKKVAIRHRNIRFLCFTKKYDLDFDNLPKNLVVRFSMWNNYGDQDKVNIKRSWFLNPKDPDRRIPQDVVHCPGSCVVCKKCWTSKKDVVFVKH